MQSVSKAVADLYLQMMFRTYNLHGSVIRPTNSYGRKFDTSFIIEYLVTQMLKGKEVYVGAPDSVRDYMYVDDHANAYLLIIKSAKANGQIYNAGIGFGISNRELAEMIAEKIEYGYKKIRFGHYPPGYPYRPSISDQPSIVLDATKIRKALNWSPKFSLDEGINKVISYFRERMPKRL